MAERAKIAPWLSDYFLWLSQAIKSGKATEIDDAFRAGYLAAEAKMNAATQGNEMTEEVKHSPGPWSIKDREIIAADTEILGVVYRAEAWTSGEPVKSEEQANARLIAAAPKLLEALRVFVEPYADLSRDELRRTKRMIFVPADQVIAARAAIAEATGRTEG